MSKFYDRVSFSTATAGTGTVTAGAATTNFRTMATAASGAAIPDGTSVEYAIEDGTAWETGTGVVGSTATTLTRVLSQSSTGALINLSGSAKVFLTRIASQLLVVDDYHEYIDAATNPSTPATGRGRAFVKSVANQRLMAVKGPLGDYHTIQPHVGRNSIALWAPAGNNTGIGISGAAIALTAVGTATAATSANTNAHTMMKRVEWLVTVAATTAVAGFRYTGQVWSRAALANYGGFTYICRWGPATGVATTTTRAFTGFRNTTAAPTDVEPSTVTNMIGMGWDAADTNIQIMHNDASGTATKVDLGASFPVPTADRTNVYELTLYCCPTDTSRVDWTVENLTTFVVASGSITTDLPATTVFLAPAGWCSVGGTLSVIGYALMQLYIKSEL